MVDKLLRGNAMYVAAYPEAFADPMKPTSSELNDMFEYGTNEGGMVFNISCAIVDGTDDANRTESDTNDERSICDVAEVQNPTFAQYGVAFDTFRDEDVDANGIFNIPFDLFKGVDRPFYIYKRIGKRNTAPFAVGDDVHIFGVTTDLPNDIIEDNAMLKFGARFKATGEVETNYRLVA